MDKLITFLRRLGSGSFKRMFRNLEQVHQESGKNRIYIFIDMVYSMFKYGVGYLDYLTFGYIYIKKDKRLTFMTMNDNVAIAKRLNTNDAKQYFNNKLLFDKAFEKYLKRDFCDLHDGYEAFEKFCEGKEFFFAKQADNFGGLGVQKTNIKGEDLKALYDRLYKDEFFLAEEAIKQHPEMNKICDKSINTIRIVTILSDKGNANFVYALLRMGNGLNDVDNVTSGGMYTLLSPEGKITHPAFCDKTVSYYDTHPYTKLPLIGFEIPYFKEAVEMCKEAAFVIPDMRYVGWDVAITPDGPVFVEGNNIPGYDMPQNHRFHDDGCGIKALFEEALNN